MSVFTISEEDLAPYVTAVPIEKAVLSESISQQAVAENQLYVVKLDPTVLQNKNIGEEVELVQIGFDNRDLIKGKVVKAFISKTIQIVMIKPLKMLKKTGVVQANLKLKSQNNIFKVPLNALRNADGTIGTIYVVNPINSLVLEQQVTVLGFEGANIIIKGEEISEMYWVVISGFHKVIKGKKVQLFSPQK
tara:strand:+ start:929 stop:1501 length:573 start_codon:yes stop_codon:yes gene_type:complete